MCEHHRGLLHIGFFLRADGPIRSQIGGIIGLAGGTLPSTTTELSTMKPDTDSPARQLAEVVSRLHEQRTGHAPKAVTVVLSEDTVVATLYGALTPAEQALARNPVGAAQVQEFHRQLFADSSDDLRGRIAQITGRKVREVGAEIEPSTGSVVHAFTTGAMVQLFLLSPSVSGSSKSESATYTSVARAEDDGLHIAPEGAGA